ncbi:MAG TPA: hypothetical protein DD671_03810 [Balneolaceae bacterium]|nr:hypothetical protein [Balneolaceae bacterium]
MEIIKIELGKLLKSVSDSRDFCIDRLLGSLKKREGILNIKKSESVTDKPQLTISFDPEIISEHQVKRMVQETANSLDQTFGHFQIRSKEFTDSENLKATASVLKNMKGVMNVLIVPTGSLFIEFNKYITQESILNEVIKNLNVLS